MLSLVLAGLISSPALAAPSRLILDLRREFAPAKVSQAEFTRLSAQIQKLKNLRCDGEEEGITDQAVGHFTQAKLSEQATLVKLGRCTPLSGGGAPLPRAFLVIRSGAQVRLIVDLHNDFYPLAYQIGNVGDITADGLDDLALVETHSAPDNRYYQDVKLVSVMAGKSRLLLDQDHLAYQNCEDTFGSVPLLRTATTVSVRPAPRPAFTLRSYTSGCGGKPVYRYDGMNTGPALR